MKDKSLSFAEFTKIVGRKWQCLTPSEKEPYEQQSFAEKETSTIELAEYITTESYKAYSEYLRDFKAKELHPQENSQSITYLQMPRPPSSPPVEEIPEFSLPSISNLLGIADKNPSQQQKQTRQSEQPCPTPL